MIDRLGKVSRVSLYDDLALVVVDFGVGTMTYHTTGEPPYPGMLVRVRVDLTPDDVVPDTQDRATGGAS